MNISGWHSHHVGKEAVVIMGGPSAISLLKLVSNLDREQYVVFVESKAITPCLTSGPMGPNSVI